MNPVHVLTLLSVSAALGLHDEVHRKASCPPGYHRAEGSSQSFLICQECAEGYFMNLNNTDHSCMECKKCRGVNMVTTEKCTTVSDTQCKCTEGFYLRSARCFPCKATLNRCRKEDCLSTDMCRLKTSVTTLPATTTTTKEGKVLFPQESTPGPSSAGLIVLVWALLPILLLSLMYCVTVFLTNNLHQYLNLCPSGTFKQDMEVPADSVSDPGRPESPTTLKFTITEETPMMEVMGPNPAHSTPYAPEGEHRDLNLTEHFPAAVMYVVINEVPLRRWKEFLRLLTMTDQQLERVELDAGSSSLERQYQQLRLWSQTSSANMEDIYAALHYMKLTGCAETIKESLEKLLWREVSG